MDLPRVGNEVYQPNCKNSCTLKLQNFEESQLLREKTTSSVFVSTCSNPVHMPSFIDLHTHATAGHVTSFACTKLHSTCSPNTSDRSLACSHHTITKIYAIRRDRPETHVHETLPANRARLLDQTGAKQWPLFSRSRQSLSGHDRSNARRPRTGRGRGPWWQRGGVVSLDGRCSAQAEQRKKPVAVVHLPGAYLSTETNLVPIRGVMRKEFDTGHTHTHTHTHGIKALWTARSTALRARDPRQE